MKNLSQKTITVCGVCGITKGETNHWWVLCYNPKTKSMLISPSGLLNSTANHLDTIIEVCGIEHLLQAEDKIRNGEDPFKA
jgi:hypothetical protein